MLNAADFNAKVDEYAQIILIPKGFKKSGLHYYKHEPPNYYALIKDTFKGSFNDYYLVYSHEAAGDNYKAILKKPQSLLRHYPVSVNVRELPVIFAVAEHPADSSYTFFNLARTYHVDKNCNESEEVWMNNFAYARERDEKLRTDAVYLETYVKEIFEIIKLYGFRFFENCDLNLCYHSIQDAIIGKKREQYMGFYLEYKSDFDAYYKLTGRDIPAIDLQPLKKNWFQKLISPSKRK